MPGIPIPRDLVLERVSSWWLIAYGVCAVRLSKRVTDRDDGSVRDSSRDVNRLTRGVPRLVHRKSPRDRHLLANEGGFGRDVDGQAGSKHRERDHEGSARARAVFGIARPVGLERAIASE